MKIRISKAFGKHPKIGWWANICIVPTITIGRHNDTFHYGTPIYCIAFHWLFWGIEFNNCKDN